MSNENEDVLYMAPAMFCRLLNLAYRSGIAPVISPSALCQSEFYLLTADAKDIAAKLAQAITSGRTNDRRLKKQAAALIAFCKQGGFIVKPQTKDGASHSNPKIVRLALVLSPEKQR